MHVFVVADKCTVKDCKNGATCNGSPDPAVCSCAPGFSGDTCQTGELKLKLNDNMHNYDKCSFFITIYFIVILQQNINMSNINQISSCMISIITDECAGRCENDGTCVRAPGSATCDCPTGFEGDNCQTGKVH